MTFHHRRCLVMATPPGFRPFGTISTFSPRVISRVANERLCKLLAIAKSSRRQCRALPDRREPAHDIQAVGHADLKDPVFFLGRTPKNIFRQAAVIIAVGLLKWMFQKIRWMARVVVDLPKEPHDGNSPLILKHRTFIELGHWAQDGINGIVFYP